MVATQTQDPHQDLVDSIEIFLATAQDEFTIDPQAQAAAPLYGYSVQTDITQDMAYLNDLEPYIFSAIDFSNDVLMQSQMICAPDKDRFFEAQENKIPGLEQKNVFEYKRKAMYLTTNACSMQYGHITESDDQIVCFGNTKPIFVLMVVNSLKVKTILNHMHLSSNGAQCAWS